MANNFLLRDELEDTGGKLLPQSYFWSPDIIVHDRMEDPVGFLSWSYQHDVSQPLPPQGGDVLIYVRAKNISTSKQAVYIHLYAIAPDLFTSPKQWVSHKLKTEDGMSSVFLSAVLSGEYGVTEKPFLFPSEKLERRMLVAIASESTEDPVAKLNNFFDHADFAYWVRENTNVCMRIPEIRSTEFMLEGDGVWNFRLFQPEQVRNFTFRININDAFPVGTHFVCTSPFFDRKEFDTEAGGTSLVFEGAETTPGKYGVVRIEYSINGEIRGEAMISVTFGISIGADFYPLGRSSVKYLQGASCGSNGITRNLDLRNEDDRKLLQQKFVTGKELQKYPKLSRYLDNTIKMANNGIVPELAVNQGEVSKNRMFSYTKEANETVSYVSVIDLESKPVCCIVKLQAIDTLTGSEVSGNVVMFEREGYMEASVDIPKSYNPAKVAFYTTLISLKENNLIQAAVTGELLVGNGAIKLFEIIAPKKNTQNSGPDINVSIENRTTCTGGFESDYKYNVKGHYTSNPTANRKMVPFFLPLEGVLTFTNDYELYPSIPIVEISVSNKDTNVNSKIAAKYMYLERNKARWKFEGNKVAWNFLEDWDSYISKDLFGCTVILKIEIFFTFKTNIGDVKITFFSDKNPGQMKGNFITMEYIRWCYGCLAKGTRIRMSDGSEKNIEEICPGDKLRGKSSSVCVTNIISKMADSLVVIKTENGNELHLTHRHPVKTERGVVPAEELTAADLIHMENSTTEALDWLLTENVPQNVYDLQLETPQCIFANGIVTGDRDEEESTKSEEINLEAAALMKELRKLIQSVSEK